jgi:hypothetical protein
MTLNFILNFIIQFNYMKLFRLLILTFVLSFIYNEEVFASHAAGGELTYEYVSGNTYKFRFKIYRDCSGIGVATTYSMCVENQCDLSTVYVTLNQIATLPGGQPNGSVISNGCPGYPTTCNGGSLIGYREYWYEGTYTLPNNCNQFIFSVDECCRNNAITNLSAPSSYFLYVEAYLNRSPGNNNSPSFNNSPVAYTCVNQPFSYNHGTTEADGDSLAFSSINPEDGTCGTWTNIPYSSATFNPTNNPFSTGNTFAVNPTNGTMSFTANAVQNVVTVTYVREFRNGVLVGYVMRDLQMAILNCTTPLPTYNLNVGSIIGGNLNNNIVNACANTPLSLCYNVTSTNPSGILVLSDNHAITAPGSNVVYTGLLTNSVQGCLNWTPTLADTGLHIITITAKDSSCLPPGLLISNTFSVSINVLPN